MKDAGIIGFVPRGEYSDTETYDFLQFVYYEGSTYVAKKETTGNTPEENNEFWQILARGQVGKYLPITGGILSSDSIDILSLQRNANYLASKLSFSSTAGVQCDIRGENDHKDNETPQMSFYSGNGLRLLTLSEKRKTIYDSKTKKEEDIMVNGDDVGNCIVNGKKLSEWLK